MKMRKNADPVMELAKTLAATDLAYHMHHTTPRRDAKETLEIARVKIDALWKYRHHNDLDVIKYCQLAEAAIEHLGNK